MSNLPSIKRAKHSRNQYSLDASDRNASAMVRAQRLAATYTGNSLSGPAVQQGGTLPSTTATSSSPSPWPSHLQRDVALHLSPAESYVAAQREEAAERWCSELLQYETNLRELVADGLSEPPSASRIIKVIGIYDAVCRVAEGQSTYLAEILRLFRIEICRAIFTNDRLQLGDVGRAAVTDGVTKHLDDDAEDDNEVPTYFDQVSTLLRENALLSSEIALGNTRERIAQLMKEIERLEEDAKAYEGEIGRLTRQSVYVMEQCRKAREELQQVQETTKQQLSDADRDLQTLNVENKDMQLQLFRLRKQLTGGKSKLLKDSYRQMKLSKMGMMATLFSEGDERIGLLVMLSQMESRVNELLDTYDNEFLLTAESGHTDLRLRLGNAVAVLMEEIHLCEQSYKRLVPHHVQNHTSEEFDETDGYVAIMFDQKIYENLLAREAVRRRLMQIDASTASLPPPIRAVADPTSGSAGDSTGITVRLNERASVTQLLGSGRGPVANEIPSSAEKGTAVTAPSAVSPATPAAPAAPVSNAGVGGGSGVPGEGSTLEEVVFLKRNEWIEHIYGLSTGATSAAAGESTEDASHHRRVREQQRYESHIPSELLMPRLLANPMRNLSSQKFMSSLDLFTGKDPAHQRLLCSVNFIDPSVPIQVPDDTNFLKIKYTCSIDNGTRRHSDEGDVTTPVSLHGISGSSAAVVSASDGNNQSVNTPAAVGSSPSVPASTRLTPAPENSSKHTGNASGVMQTPNAPAAHAYTGSGGGGRKDAALARGERPVAARELTTWGGRTTFTDEVVKDDAAERDILDVNENLRVFRELASLGTINSYAHAHQAGAVSSTTAATVAFQRLNPLSPNRAPEWALYKSLFGGYRSLTPRMIEFTTLDHIMLKACDRHFTRMEYRYRHCLVEANLRTAGNQMSHTVAERFFRDLYQLTDFQEALLDELEARYGFPELVAKNLYEMLCYMDAMASKEPLLNCYLNVIRGFQSATHIHFICAMLYHLSFCWPSSSPSEEVSREDVLTVLRYIYRNAGNVVRVDIYETLKDYEMATRSAPLTFVGMRNFLAQSMLHQEEPLLLFFNSLFSNHTTSADTQEVTFDMYNDVIGKFWQEKVEQKSHVRFLTTSLGFNKGPLLSTKDLACVAASAWYSDLWT